VNRRRVLLLIGCLLPVAWLLWSKSALPQTVRMSDGSTVTVVAVTYGKKHGATVGSLGERFAARLPSKLFPKWPRPLSVRTNTERDTLVLWFISTNSLASGEFLSWFWSSNSVEIQISRILTRRSAMGKGVLIGMAVDAFPRRERSLTLGLRSLGNPQVPPPSGTLTVPNPARAHGQAWRGMPLPQRVVTKEFVCELEKCELNLSKGFDASLSMIWNFYKEGARDWHWRVQTVELEDATGNFLRERCKDFTPASLRERMDFGILPETGPLRTDFARSILPGVGAWKVRAQVIRAGSFQTNEVWEVRDIPLRGQRGYGRQIWQTNIFGTSLKLASPALRFGNSTDWPLLLSSDSQDGLDRTTLVTLVDDQGREPMDRTALSTGRSAFGGDCIAGWICKWSTGATSCTARLGVSHWREVEFLVEPTVIDRKP